MALPKPFPGLVLNYAYLWRNQAEAGMEEAIKDRPCVVVTAVIEDQDGPLVYVCPVTHTPLRNPDDAVEIPHSTKQRLGLDDARSWIVTSEVNRFYWPGFDLRPIPGKTSWDCVYGVLPPKFFQAVTQVLSRRTRLANPIIRRQSPNRR